MEHRIFLRHPLGNPKRIWRQDNFILSTFSLRAENMRDAVENCKEVGLNLIELGWATHEQAEEAIPLCEEYGIDLLFQDYSVFGGMQEKFLERRITKETARSLANKLRPWKRVIGYYVWDEPYVDDQLEEARRQMDLLMAEDPTRLPFVVAIPSYNKLFLWDNGKFPEYLRKYVEVLEPPVLSLDYYPIGRNIYIHENQLDDCLMWCDLELMRQLCREHHLPLWFYYEGKNHHHFEPFTFPMIRMMMYSAVLYGTKALQCYTSEESIILKTGKKGPFFDDYKVILKEFQKLGNTLMALESKYVFHSADLLPDCPYPFGDDISKAEIISGTLPSRVSAAELTDAYGNRYLVVLNRDYEKTASFTLPLKQESRIYLVNREDGRQHLLEDSARFLNISLPMGDAVIYRVQPAEEAPFTLEYRLDK